MAEVPKEIDTGDIPRPIEYFEIGVFAICTLYGAVALADYDNLAATSIKLYPGWGGVIFLVMLLIGGLTGLISLAFRTVLGPKVELASLTMLVLQGLAYVVWTPFSVGARGIGLLLFMGVLITVPGYFRCRKLARYIETVESMNSRNARGEESGGSEPVGSVDNGDNRSRWWK